MSFAIDILLRLIRFNWHPDTKRKITICHLFLNYKLSIKDVAKTLDETYKHAVSVLIEQGIIQERRSVSREEATAKANIVIWFPVEEPRVVDSACRRFGARRFAEACQRIQGSQDGRMLTSSSDPGSERILTRSVSNS